MQIAASDAEWPQMRGSYIEVFRPICDGCRVIGLRKSVFEVTITSLFEEIGGKVIETNLH